MSSNDEDNIDSYGFSKYVKYNRQPDYPNLKPDISVKKFALYIFIGIFIFILLLAGTIAGYHAWNEFPGDSNVTKVIKTYIAVMFAPFYLFYVFLKVQFFKQ